MWQSARARLAELAREASSEAPRTRQIAVSLREPYTGRVMEARGAVAVAPSENALRMMLLGPGGTTALDLWIRDDEYRFAVPALELLRRGDRHTPVRETRGMPVSFLRWWLLDPFQGKLLWAEREEGDERYVLRDDEAIVHVTRKAGGGVRAERTVWSDEPDRRVIEREVVVASGLGCDEVEYRQQSTGLEVTVRCESESPGIPNPRAFEDPDRRTDG